MSEHPRVERRDLKKIYVCDDVWFGVFAFLDCALLGLKCALLSCRFDALVYKHLKGKDWSLCCLDILENEKGTCTRKLFGGLSSNATQIMIRYGHAKYFPIVSAPPPGIINKFKCLFIRHVDQNVINFLERIPRLFNNEIIVNLYMLCNQNNSWNILTKKIWPLLTSNLTKMVLNVDQLVLLRRFVSANVLRDCTNLRLIGSHNLFPEMPADDRSEASPGQALAKWLHTPLKDGRPKVFNLDSMSNNVKKNIEEIKKAFINDLTPAKYIIGLKFKVVGSAPFVLENGITRERLTLRHYIAGFCVLTRGPIDWDEKRWAKWDFESINIFRLINNLEKAQRLGNAKIPGMGIAPKKSDRR